MGDIRIREQSSDRLTFEHNGTVIAEYVFAPTEPQRESPRPYFSPLRTLSGREVAGFRPEDHVWHKGLSLALPVVNDENFWGGPSYLGEQGYVQLPNNGIQQHRSFVASDGTESSVTELLDWVTESGETILTEQRGLSATIIDDRSWLLIFSSSLLNVSSQALHFGSPTTRGRADAGYGGLFWRGPVQFGGGHGIVHAPSGSGSGGFGDALRGARARWMGFSGRAHDTDPWSTVVMVDATQNPGHPTEWFVRSEEYACLNPAHFFSSEYVLEPGETLSLRYGVAIADDQADWISASALASAAHKGLAEPVSAFRRLTAATPAPSTPTHPTPAPTAPTPSGSSSSTPVEYNNERN